MSEKQVWVLDINVANILLDYYMVPQWNRLEYLKKFQLLHSIAEENR